MKIKKSIILIVIPFLLLSACSTGSIIPQKENPGSDVLENGRIEYNGLVYPYYKTGSLTKRELKYAGTAGTAGNSTASFQPSDAVLKTNVFQLIGKQILIYQDMLIAESGSGEYLFFAAGKEEKKKSWKSSGADDSAPDTLMYQNKLYQCMGENKFAEDELSKTEELGFLSDLVAPNRCPEMDYQTNMPILEDRLLLRYEDYLIASNDSGETYLLFKPMLVYWWGRYVREAQNRDVIIIDLTRPVIMTKGTEDVIFDEFQTGDYIFIGVYNFQESCPVETEVFEVKLTERGTFEDIEPEELKALNDLGLEIMIDD